MLHVLPIASLACALAATPEPVRIDLDADVARQVVVDRETNVYLGHVSTILLDDHKTLLCTYPKGHGNGPIVLKRSDDGGRTWSDRLPTPASWQTSLETPTIFSMGQGEQGQSLILFSGLYPIRAARSQDSGAHWTELAPIGDFGGIVAMGGVARTGPHDHTAFFHDDGRFIASQPKKPSTPGAKPPTTFTLYQTDTHDDGTTWSAPRAIWSGSDIHLCEPGVVFSPDHKAIALLLRENRRIKPSHIMLSTDNAQSWSAPREMSPELTGDRHIARYAPDGRLVVTFRCMRQDDPWKGDWVAWIGTWDQLVSTTRDERADAPYLVRLKDNLTDWDCAYAGLECLPDGTFVATTYGTWTAGQKPFILSVRFPLADLDALAGKH